MPEPITKISEYQQILEALIWQLFYAAGGKKLEYEGKTYKLTGDSPAQAINNQKDIRFLIQSMKDEVRVQGIRPTSPFYNEIMTYARTPQWEAEQAQIATERQFEEERARQENLRGWEALKQAAQKQSWQAGLQRSELLLGMSQAGRDWQERQEKLGLERLGLQEAEKERRWNLQMARTAAFLSPPTMSNEEKASIWESARQEILGQLGGARDWIKQWQVKQMGNPYQQEQSIEGRWNQRQEEVKRLETARKDILQRLQNPNDKLTWEGIMNPDTPEEYHAKMVIDAANVARQQLLEFESSPEFLEERKWAQPREVGPGQFAVGRPQEPAKPTTPPTPTWLKRIYPTMPTQIEKREVMPLSGQMWTAMQPSERLGWMGYGEWAGAVPEDVLGQMEAMRPRTPRTPYQWSPARQMA